MSALLDRNPGDPWRNDTPIRFADQLATLPTAGPEDSDVAILTPWKSTTPRNVRNIKDGEEDTRRATTSAQGKKREGLKCYNCQKTGHYARDCRGRKVQPQQRKAEFQPYEVNVMTKTENKSPIVTTCDEHDAVAKKDHASIHWTFCYEDSCTTHGRVRAARDTFPARLVSNTWS